VTTPFLDRARVEAALTSLPVRLVVPLVLLAAHLVLATESGVRFGAPFNAAPGQPPAFVNPVTDRAPERWNRLVISRWDTGHYLNLGVRGFEACPPRGQPGYLSMDMRCDLAFYPTYGFLARWASLGGLIPIDYAMLILSLAASYVFLFLWTGPALVSRLGVGRTWLSLLLYNAFTTAFALVTAQTEPLTLAFTLGAFVALSRERRALAAFLAGAATSMRVTGAATGIAMGLALLVDFWEQERARPAGVPAGVALRLRQAGVLLACGWGLLGLMGFFAWRFGDPLAYVHAHNAAFHHDAASGSLLWPDPEWLTASIEHPLHEGVWLAAALIWFLLGRKQAMAPFPRRERVFWYGLFGTTLAIPVLSLISLSFVGMNRYLLLALPLFFAMASAMRRNAVLIALWIGLSAFHYWNVDLCTYTGGPGQRTLEICHTKHWVGHI
jgi:hypothetical protein